MDVWKIQWRGVAGNWPLMVQPPLASPGITESCPATLTVCSFTKQKAGPARLPVSGNAGDVVTVAPWIV